MTITARAVAMVCGAFLGGFGALGFLIPHNSSAESSYLLASWLPPIALFPAAALAVALESDARRRVGDQATALWPTYVGLALYAAVAGDRWIEASGRGSHENFAGLFLFLVMAVHAAVFLAGGMALVPFDRTRPAAFQMWIGYVVLLVCWVVGGFAL